MNKPDKQQPERIPAETEVLRRMLNAPPAPFTPKPKKKRQKQAATHAPRRLALIDAWSEVSIDIVMPE
jgi:hypothetical protein